MYLYEIRRARPEELLHLPEIERRASALFRDTKHAFLADAEPTPLHIFTAQQQQGLVWVATLGGQPPAGFALARILDGAIYLQEMDVDPQHARRGLGKRLVQAVCEGARRAGYPAVTLSTFRDLPWNAPFYEKLGFRVLAEAELRAGLQTVRQQETQIGFPRAERVCMRHDLAGASPERIRV